MIDRKLHSKGQYLSGAALLCGAALLAFPSHAWAQSTPQTTPAPTPVPTEEEAPSSGSLEEIIVTAQRRAENLQEVPIAVTAITSDALENAGISATKDLPQIVPSVQMTRSGPIGLFFIRGVGTTNAAAGEEGANAVYVDGVYLGDLSQTINNFNNIERVEVLKGPQGTLFGRNASGGLLHVITREPGNEWVLDAQLGLANYDTVSSQVYVAAPISSTISADIAWTNSHQNKGWGRNLTLNRKSKISDYSGLRSKIVLRASDAVKFTLAGDYFESTDNLGLAWRLKEGTLGTLGTTSPGGHDTTSNTYAETKLRIWGVSLTAEADLGFATLTSISAFRKNRNESAFDVDGGPINLVNIDYTSDSKTLQQEVRLASSATNPLSWQIGAFYLHSEASTDPQFQTGIAFAPNLGSQINAELKTNSYAAFGEATYAITPRTKLTGGIRFTADRRKFDGTARTILADGTLGATTASVDSNLKYNEITYRAALRQELNDDVSAYVSYNRGFKAGAYSLQNPASPAVRPQFINAYEIGLKSEWFDRRLRLNLAAYHYDISDYQVRSAATAGAGTSVLLNAASVKVDGFDLEFEAAPTSEWRMFGGFTVLNSRFSSYPTAPFVYQNPAVCDAPGTADPGTTIGTPIGGTKTCFGDASGNRVPLSPKFSASFGSSYTVPAGDGEVRLSALYSYNSGYVFESDNVFKQGHFSLVNASIEYRPTETLGIEFWGKNLTDTEYSVQDLSSGTGTTETLAAPRTYGVNLKLNF